MGQIYNSDSIALSGAGGGGGTTFTVDGISPDGANNIQLNADSYCGTWASGTTYRLNNRVSATLNGIPGEFVCIADTTTASLTDSTAWRRIAGTASAIDGLSANSKGNIEYNRSLEPTSETITPQCTGELSWTINIDGPVVVDLSRFTNTLFNTNPASVIRLVINAGAPYDVTFTGSDAYWTQESGYTNVPPVISLDGTIPLTVVEVSLITDRLVPGALVRTVFPVAEAGGGDTPSETFGLTVVKDGETLNCTTAAPGAYYFEVGSTISGIPSSIDDIADPVLTVYKTGYSARLSHFGRVNISGVNRDTLIATEWMLFPKDNSGTLYWRWMGDNGIGTSPQASASKTVLSVQDASAASLLISAADEVTEKKSELNSGES